MCTIVYQERAKFARCIKDHERTATEEPNMATWMATTRSGDDVESTSVDFELDDIGCTLNNFQAYVSVTAGVDELFEDWPDS